MRPAHTPSSVKGSISKCVVSLQNRTKEKHTRLRNDLVFIRQFICVFSLVYHVFIEGDLTVILFVDVKVLHQPIVKKVFKVSRGKNRVFKKSKHNVY